MGNKKHKKNNSVNDDVKKDIVENEVISDENNTNENDMNEELPTENNNIDTANEDVISSDEEPKSDSSYETENDEVIEESPLEVTENIIDNSVEEKSETNESSFNVVKEKKSHKKLFASIFILLFILIATLIFSTIFAILNMNSTKIISGIHIDGISVSGLTREEAITKVSEIYTEKLSESITLKYKNYETTIFPEQFDISFNIESAVDIAYNKGRSGNIFENNFDILSSMLSNINIGPQISYSEETFDSLIQEMETSLEDRLIEPSYYVDGSNLIITKGRDGVVINSSNLKTELIYSIKNLNCNITSVEIPVINKTANSVDINEIHSQIYKAAQDAYYTTDPFVVYPHAEGIDFAISMEEATALLVSEEENISIPLAVIKPSVTTNQIGTEAFPDLLASFSTSYSIANTNRTTNIKLATNKINGIVIMPGETFSYNQTVGQRTVSAGFKTAAVYSNGEVTTGIGGGICQVSTTLYNAILLANLEIVERTNHGFNPGYVKAGTDATVSWGGPDFKFKNNRNYPIKIVCYNNGGKNYFEIYGLRSENEYEVEIEAYVTQSIPYKTVRKEDSTLAKGTTKVIQNGSNGCKSVAYRILKLNGQVVSKTLLSEDTYNPHNKIIAVGTKE